MSRREMNPKKEKQKLKKIKKQAIQLIKDAKWLSIMEETLFYQTTKFKKKKTKTKKTSIPRYTIEVHGSIIKFKENDLP